MSATFWNKRRRASRMKELENQKAVSPKVEEIKPEAEAKKPKKNGKSGK